MRVYCDFDGTITRLDTTDLVLRRLASPVWTTLEAQWVAGEISAAECMRGQIASVGGDEDALDSLLDTVPIDPSFPAFARWCAAEETPLVVVSDGVDYFIRRILARYGLGHLALAANALHGGPGARHLAHPFLAADCASGLGVCKCVVAGLLKRGSADDPVVFIGNGRSDFCAAGNADLVFARDELAAHMQAERLPHTRFATFHDVIAALRTHRAGVSPVRGLSAS